MHIRNQKQTPETDLSHGSLPGRKWLERTGLALAGLGAFSAAAPVLEAAVPAAVGQTLEDGRVKEAPLVMQASAIRSKHVFITDVAVYKIELWLQKPSSQLNVLLSSDQKIQLKMQMLRAVTQDQMKEATQSGFRNNLSAQEYQALKPKIDEFIKVNCTSMASGDRSAVSFDGGNVLIEKNGKLIKEFRDDPAFRKAVLKLWLSPNPIDEGIRNMRDALLRGGRKFPKS